MNWIPTVCSDAIAEPLLAFSSQHASISVLVSHFESWGEHYRTSVMYRAPHWCSRNMLWITNTPETRVRRYESLHNMNQPSRQSCASWYLQLLLLSLTLDCFHSIDVQSQIVTTELPIFFIFFRNLLPPCVGDGLGTVQTAFSSSPHLRDFFFHEPWDAAQVAA